MNMVVAAGLCDPGANGPQARVVRLPVGENGKHTPPYRCRMATWAPDVRYSLEELVAGLNLKSASSASRKKRRAGGADDAGDNGDPIWTPRPEENSVLVALRERGLLICTES